MSFYNCMRPYLYYKPKKNEDNLFYIRNLTEVLNLWLGELRLKYSTPVFKVNGIVTSPGGVSFNYFGMVSLRSKTVLITPDEVQTAMWCGNETESFPNLFNLIGKKIQETFIALNCETTGIISFPRILLNTNHFAEYGSAFINAAKTSNMNPEKFLSLENEFLNLALTNTPLEIVPVYGMAPGGMFNGQAEIQLFGI